MMHVTNSNNVASLSWEWVKEILIYFNIIKPGQVKDLRNINSLDKKTIRTNHNRKAIVVRKYYHDNADKNFVRFFRFVKPATVINSGWFPRIAYIYKKRDVKETAQADVQKEDIYLPEFYSYDLTYHVVTFIFTLPKDNHLQNLLAPKDNLINETTPEKINLFSKIFLSSQKKRF